MLVGGGGVVTWEQAAEAFGIVKSLAIERIDQLVLDDGFRRALGVDDAGLIAIVQAVQLKLFPSEFGDAGGLSDAGEPAGGRSGPDVLPAPTSRGVGRARAVAAAAAFKREWADNSPHMAELVAEHLALRERHRAEREVMLKRVAANPQQAVEAGGPAVLAGKLRQRMTAERWLKGGPLVERIRRAAELWKKYGTTRAVAEALNVSQRTATLDLKDAVRMKLIDGNGHGQPVRVTAGG